MVLFRYGPADRSSDPDRRESPGAIS